jgi:hypothetical protein
MSLVTLVVVNNSILYEVVEKSTLIPLNITLVTAALFVSADVIMNLQHS